MCSASFLRELCLLTSLKEYNNPEWNKEYSLPSSILLKELCPHKSVLKILPISSSRLALAIRYRSWRQFLCAYILPIRDLCATAFCICPLFFTTKNHKQCHRCDESVSICIIDQVRSTNDDPNALLQINR